MNIIIKFLYYDLNKLKHCNTLKKIIYQYQKDLQGLSLLINPTDSQKGDQHLIIEAKLYDDAGKPRGQVFTKNVFVPNSGAPGIGVTEKRVLIRFKNEAGNNFEDILPWYSIYLKVKHHLDRYSPGYSKEEQEEVVDDYSWEQQFVYAASPWKGSFDIVSPIQQSVYVFENDSARASLFNVGLNWLWYKRKNTKEQSEYDLLSYGFGFFVSNLDKLADTQFVSFGWSLLVNFNIENRVQIALGPGAVFEYRFKDRGHQSRGSNLAPSLVLQFRLPRR